MAEVWKGEGRSKFPMCVRCSETGAVGVMTAGEITVIYEDGAVEYCDPPQAVQAPAPAPPAAPEGESQKRQRNKSGLIKKRFGVAEDTCAAAGELQCFAWSPRGMSATAGCLLAAARCGVNLVHVLSPSAAALDQSWSAVASLSLIDRSQQPQTEEEESARNAAVMPRALSWSRRVPFGGVEVVLLGVACARQVGVWTLRTEDTRHGKYEPRRAAVTLLGPEDGSGSDVAFVETSGGLAMAVATSCGQVRVWSLAGGEGEGGTTLVCSALLEVSPACLRYACGLTPVPVAEGSDLLAFSLGNDVCLWMGDQKVIKGHAHEDLVTGVSYSARSGEILTCGLDGLVVTWKSDKDTSKLELSKTLRRARYPGYVGVCTTPSFCSLYWAIM